MKASERQPYSLRRLRWIAVAALLTFCACLGFVMFANRDNPSAVPTIQVEDLATAATGIAPSGTPSSAQYVQLRLSPRFQGTLLFVEGVTDLPNRALLMYEVREVSASPLVASGTMPVLDGRFSRDVDLTGWHAGTLSVWVGFQTVLSGNEQQPPEVLERFGQLGEFLYGDNVTESDGRKRVEVSQTVEFAP